MSDQISIKGVHGFGYHGVFDFEARDGQDFYVDALLTLDLTKPSRSDALEDSVDYGAICDLILTEIKGERVQLIEALAGRIADAILRAYSKVDAVAITVHKPQAPVKAEVLDIAVTIERRR